MTVSGFTDYNNSFWDVIESVNDKILPMSLLHPDHFEGYLSWELKVFQFTDREDGETRLKGEISIMTLFPHFTRRIHQHFGNISQKLEDLE